MMYLFLIFCALVIGDYLFTALSSAFAAFDSGAFSPIGTMTPFNGSAGLTAVNFNIFDKNGVGKSYVTQGYGNTPYAYLYVNHWHNGIDIAARYGAPIYSPIDNGLVLATGNQDNYCPGKGFGRYVAIQDSLHGLVLWFAHLGNIGVSPGQIVSKGEGIATVGNSGLETGTHLHFSIFEQQGFSMVSKNGCGPDADGKDVNPLNYLGTVYQ